MNVNTTDIKVFSSRLVSKTQYDSDKKRFKENIEAADKKRYLTQVNLLTKNSLINQQQNAEAKLQKYWKTL